MRLTLFSVLCLILTIHLVNCQTNDNDGYLDDSTRNVRLGSTADEKRLVDAKLIEQEDLRPKSTFSEERFSQLFVPRNSRRKLVSPRYTSKPRPTLPSFIKKPVSVPPPDFEAPAPRAPTVPSSTRPPPASRATRTTSTTSRPVRGRNRSTSNKFDETSSTSTTEPSRRSVFSTRRPSNRLFPNRNRN